MNLELTGDLSGLSVEVDDGIFGGTLLHIEARVLRHLIARIQQAESRLELTQAQMLDRASDLITAAAILAGR